MERNSGVSDTVRPERSRGVPWLPVLTALGLTAAAVVVTRRMMQPKPAHRETLDDLLAYCDGAASVLDQRISVNGALTIH